MFGSETADNRRNDGRCISGSDSGLQTTPNVANAVLYSIPQCVRIYIYAYVGRVVNRKKHISGFYPYDPGNQGPHT